MKTDTDIMKKDEAAACEMRRLYRSYGYTQFKMSRFEEYDLYVRNKDFLISDNIITGRYAFYNKEQRVQKGLRSEGILQRKCLPRAKGKPLF